MRMLEAECKNHFEGSWQEFMVYLEVVKKRFLPPKLTSDRFDMNSRMSLVFIRIRMELGLFLFRIEPASDGPDLSQRCFLMRQCWENFGGNIEAMYNAIKAFGKHRPDVKVLQYCIKNRDSILQELFNLGLIDSQ